MKCEMAMNRARLLTWTFGSLALALGCAGVKPNAGGTGTGATGNSTGIGGFGGSGMTVAMPCVGTCKDFPSTPVVVGSAPANAGSIFGTPGSGSTGGPCMIEPQDNTLFPNNWLRPRFRFTSGAGLYELRMKAANQANDLVVYTTDTTWTMPRDMWTALAVHTRDMPIEVTVRSAPMSGGQVLVGGTVHFT